MPRISNRPFLFRNNIPQCPEEDGVPKQHYGIALLCVKDHKTIILSEVNGEFLQLTGQDRHDLIHINLNKNAIWNDNGQLWQAICQCLADQEPQVIRWPCGGNEAAPSVSCSIIPTAGAGSDLTAMPTT